MSRGGTILAFIISMIIPHLGDHWQGIEIFVGLIVIGYHEAYAAERRRKA